MRVAISDIYVDWKANTRGTVSEDSAEDLARSIANLGLINPVTVATSDPEVTSKPYTLVAGYTRFHACRKYLNWSEIEVNISDADAFLVSIEENLKRTNLTMYQEAVYLQRWVNVMNVPIRDVANKINRPVTWVNARLQLLELDEETQRLADSTKKAITQQEISEKYRQKKAAEKKIELKPQEPRRPYLTGKKKDPRPRLNGEMQDLVRQLVDMGMAGSPAVIALNWACGLLPNQSVIEAFGVDVE